MRGTKKSLSVVVKPEIGGDFWSLPSHVNDQISEEPAHTVHLRQPVRWARTELQVF